MAIRHYLAMTASEMRACRHFPENTAWMACHLSPYGAGLSAMPKTLKPESLLILDDCTPIYRHDPALILEELQNCVQELALWGVLLDFQRPGYPGELALAKTLTEGLRCPVAVSELYAGETDGAVFLAPTPLTVPLKKALDPWKEREIWLDTSLGGEEISLSPNGAAARPTSQRESPETGHSDETLHCHYQIRTEEEKAIFTLWRTREDLDALLQEAEAWGIKTAVGLYQELK